MSPTRRRSKFSYPAPRESPVGFRLRSFLSSLLPRFCPVRSITSFFSLLRIATRRSWSFSFRTTESRETRRRLNDEHCHENNVVLRLQAHNKSGRERYRYLEASGMAARRLYWKAAHHIISEIGRYLSLIGETLCFVPKYLLLLTSRPFPIQNNHPPLFSKYLIHPVLSILTCHVHTIL